jgi:hypothetical protein
VLRSHCNNSERDHARQLGGIEVTGKLVESSPSDSSGNLAKFHARQGISGCATLLLAEFHFLPNSLNSRRSPFPLTTKFWPL